MTRSGLGEQDVKDARAGGVVRCICLAIYNGDTDALLAQRDEMDWDRLLRRDPFHRLVNNAGHTMENSHLRIPKARSDLSFSLLLHWAIKDDRPDVFALYEGEQPDFPEPVRSIIAKGMGQSLAKFLDNGFDPESKRGCEGLDAFEFAMKLNQTDMVVVMASFQARARAHGLIHEMDALDGPKKFAAAWAGACKTLGGRSVCDRPCIETTRKGFSYGRR